MDDISTQSEFDTLEENGVNDILGLERVLGGYRIVSFLEPGDEPDREFYFTKRGAEAAIQRKASEFGLGLHRLRSGIVTGYEQVREELPRYVMLDSPSKLVFDQAKGRYYLY